MQSQTYGRNVVKGKEQSLKTKSQNQRTSLFTCVTIWILLSFLFIAHMTSPSLGAPPFQSNLS